MDDIQYRYSKLVSIWGVHNNEIIGSIFDNIKQPIKSFLETEFKLRCIPNEKYYKILQIETESSLGEIKKAYRTLAKQFHPDLNGDIATENFLKICKAYKKLTGQEESDELLCGLSFGDDDMGSTKLDIEKEEEIKKQYRKSYIVYPDLTGKTQSKFYCYYDKLTMDELRKFIHTLPQPYVVTESIQEAKQVRDKLNQKLVGVV